MESGGVGDGETGGNSRLDPARCQSKPALRREFCASGVDFFRLLMDERRSRIGQFFYERKFLFLVTNSLAAFRDAD
jgi:hypothetical protein